MDADRDDKKGAGLKFPPPLIAIVMIALAWQIEGFLPWPVLPAAGWWPLGAACVGGALALAVAAVWHLRRAGTAVEPWHPSTAIVQHGVYRFSRNPIYLSFCLATLGVGLWRDSGWIVAAVVPVAGLLYLLVIRREEAYLEARFGDAYRDYCRRVRRWL